ncbi:hypothetical protein HU200_037143 [Digitaria exilis]|uniref:Uncharacterized protein n=1 Tax=Digitaria exilis TaxID=1010633 RepID=A0A835BFJ5_9POAL|nr:hypothetical protein HU200_037143 [Digitaria exilis]
MAPTAALPEQQPLPFTFTSPVSSERHEDALDFDYGSWIQQSKMTNCYSKLWLEDAADAQAINRHHREMMLQAVDNLPEEAYELSLRDLSDLALTSRAATTDDSALSSSKRLSTARSPSNSKSWRKKTPAMEGAGFIIKLFMPSPSRRAGGGGGRKKRLSSSTLSTLRESNASINDSSTENVASETRIDHGYTFSHSMPRKSHRDTTSRYLQTLSQNFKLCQDY